MQFFERVLGLTSTHAVPATPLGAFGVLSVDVRTHLARFFSVVSLCRLSRCSRATKAWIDTSAVWKFLCWRSQLTCGSKRALEFFFGPPKRPPPVSLAQSIRWWWFTKTAFISYADTRPEFFLFFLSKTTANSNVINEYANEKINHILWWFSFGPTAQWIKARYVQDEKETGNFGIILFVDESSFNDVESVRRMRERFRHVVVIALLPSVESGSVKIRVAQSLGLHEPGRPVIVTECVNEAHLCEGYLSHLTGIFRALNSRQSDEVPISNE